MKEKICFRCDNGKGHKMKPIINGVEGDLAWVCPNCNFIVLNNKAKGVVTV